MESSRCAGSRSPRLSFEHRVYRFEDQEFRAWVWSCGTFDCPELSDRMQGCSSWRGARIGMRVGESVAEKLDYRPGVFTLCLAHGDGVS